MANDRDAADVAAVAACLRDAMQRKDVAVALSLMTDDIVVVPPVGPPIAGLDAVRATLTAEPRLGWFKYEYDVEHAFGDLTVEVLGNNAVVASDDSGVVMPRNKALPTVTMRGRVINVFRRRVDGWRLARSVNLMAKVRTPA